MPDAPTWLNTDAAIADIGITPATLRRLVDRGEVVAVQIGRVHRYRQEDLDAFLRFTGGDPGRLGTGGVSGFGPSVSRCASRRLLLDAALGVGL